MRKRGRLCAVDMLPASADDVRAWAIDAAKSRRLTQIAILEGLNSRLEQLGIEPVSRSAFNRWITIGLNRGFSTERVQVQADVACCPTCGARLSATRRKFMAGGRA